MSENILSDSMQSAPERGDSSTGDAAESQGGTPKVGGVSPMVVAAPKKFPYLLFFLLILLAIATAFSVYLFYQVRTLTLDKISPSPIPSPVASADPTVGWETYTDPNNEFTFKYPEEWKIEERSGSHLLFPKTNGDIQKPLIILYTIDNPKSLTIPEYESAASNKEGPSPNIYSQKAVEKIVGGVVGYYLEGIGCEPTFCDKFSISNDQYIYSFMSLYYGVGDEVNPSQRTIFDQILSTFKLTDSSSTTPYTCPASGWQNCMPILSEEGKRACSQEAMAWYEKNCPDFQGAAL